MENLVTYEKNDGIAVLSINRPKALNALNKEVVDRMEAIVDSVAKDTDVKVLILYSKENFAAGADIKALAECTPKEAEAFAFYSTYGKIEDLEIPTIAAIEGYALGGGLELSLTCDFRIVSKTAKLGLPEINLGIMPGAGGTIRLPRLIGESRAKEMIFTGMPINSEKAFEIGLVNAVIEGSVLDEALEWAGKLKNKAPIAIKTAKLTIREGLTKNTREGIALEGKNWANLFSTADQKEGMHAFLGKRKPCFQGK